MAVVPSDDRSDNMVIVCGNNNKFRLLIAFFRQGNAGRIPRRVIWKYFFSERFNIFEVLLFVRANFQRKPTSL